MKISRHYQINGTEYMVLDGSAGQVPGQQGIALLAHRRSGVGADRVMVVAGCAPSFRVYDADGGLAVPTREDYTILVSYLRERGISWNSATIARKLGSNAFLAASHTAIFEAHITESFWNKALQQDMGKLAIA